jgi:hypothetical protein
LRDGAQAATQMWQMTATSDPTVARRYRGLAQRVDT